VLFSNDAFGQHYASEKLFNDLVDQTELFTECLKYYANILTPFSHLVEKKIQEFLSLKLPLSMICTSHGVIWRSNPVQIVERYLQWAAAYKENQVTIAYDTMWNGTRIMAEEIAKGLGGADPSVTVKLFSSCHTDKNDLIAEFFKSKAVVVGSPTINHGILSSVAALLEMVRGLGFKGKQAAAFGTYGWSGESPRMIAEALRGAGFSVASDPLKIAWNPSEADRATCREFGESLARAFA
jgi:flavorubredoxin